MDFATESALEDHQLRSNLVGMVHYKSAQIIDTLGPAEVFIDLIVRHGPP